MNEPLLPKVILVDIVDPQTSEEESRVRLDELENLLTTYGGFVIVRKLQRKQIPDYSTYIGKGKVREIMDDALELEAEYVIINNLLKPQQLFNLERRFEKHGIKVWDKVDLILKIFQKHATTREAKLQIELASLKHLGPRIFKMGLELSRQGGGVGTRGKGETNTETMKRHIRLREQKIRTELKGIEKSHESQRDQRRNQGFKTVAIVGYTNAGKSCLLRTVTKKQVKVQDELFATLDSRIGKMYLPDTQSECLLSDTIGFIRDLPPDLIEAFKSTLAEAINADLLLHVMDASDPELEWKIRVVDEILEEIGCGEKRRLHIFNKQDLISTKQKAALRKKYAKLNPLFISAAKKENLDELKGAVAKEI